MDRKLFFSTIFTALLSAGCASSGDASRLDLMGDPAPVSAATRTIVIAPDTKYVNVTGGETVKFVVGEKSFAWDFDGNKFAFDLNQAAPPGVLDHQVVAYVEPNVDEYGGGGLGHWSGGSHGGPGGGAR